VRDRPGSRWTFAIGLLSALSMLSWSSGFAQPTAAEDASAPIHVQVTAANRDAAASAQVHYHITRARTEAGATAALNGPESLSADKLRAGRMMAMRQIARVPSPGFYPANLAFFAGLTIQSAVLHNVYLGCADGSCWGNPLGFEKDLVKSRFIHLVDQYVGSTASRRYTVGAEMPMGAVASNCSTASMCTGGDIIAIAFAASAVGGAGPGHIYHIFLPQGVDTCANLIGCYSPDNPAQFTFCGYHAWANAGGKTTYFTVEPYQDVPGCAVAVPGQNEQIVNSTDSVLSHETFETLTDPDGDAWFNVNSLNEFEAEIGDVCQGPPNMAGEAIVPSFAINGHLYSIQLEYSNKYRACSASP